MDWYYATNDGVKSMEKDKMTSVISMRVKCPRCGKIHDVPQGIDEVDCDCHKYCPSGSKPSDCSIHAEPFSHEVGWPVGIHRDAVDEGDDEMHVTYHCTTHNKKYYKVPIIIPVNWNIKRLPKDLRYSSSMP